MQDEVVPGVDRLEVVARRPVGTVYRGIAAESKRTVAVTVVEAALSDQQRARFEHEYRALSSIGGQAHVLTVLDSGVTTSGKPYLVTEYLTRTLADFLAQNGALRWQEAVALGIEVASGLAAAHQVGVLHRDVSPENVLMAYGDVPRLSGFGLARYTAPSAEAADSDTPRFIHAAPEVVLGKPVDERADIYSLASVIHQTISGSAPFLTAGAAVDELLDRIATAEPPSLTAQGVPDGVDAVIRTALAKDPNQRPASAKLFAQQLLAAAKAAGEATAALTRPAGALLVAGDGDDDIDDEALVGAEGGALARRTPRRPPRRWPALAAFAAVAALVIAGLAWIVGRDGDDSAGGDADSSSTVGVTATTDVALVSSVTTTSLSTTGTATTGTATTAAATTARATTAATTTVATITTSTMPGGFQITGFTSEAGGTTFRIPDNGEERSFEYEVFVAQNEESFHCPVRTGLKRIEGPGLAEIDLGRCFPPNDPPNKLTLQAFNPGTTTFKLWVCDGESRGGTCPGTRSQNFIEITVIVEPA